MTGNEKSHVIIQNMAFSVNTKQKKRKYALAEVEVGLAKIASLKTGQYYMAANGQSPRSAK